MGLASLPMKLRTFQAPFRALNVSRSSFVLDSIL